MCKFFMWTAALNRCWTADRLARKGLPHPAVCSLCDQVEETADQLLVTCVFSRQVWFRVLQKFGLQILAPQTDLFFSDWSAAASARVDGQVQKGFNSIIILGAWSIWKHWNRCVFNGAPPDVSCGFCHRRGVTPVVYTRGSRSVTPPRHWFSGCLGSGLFSWLGLSYLCRM
jgi:hypothetical protein